MARPASCRAHYVVARAKWLVSEKRLWVLGYRYPRDILQGQIDDKSGALADVAFDTDGAGMCLNDLSRDVETETKAAKATDRPRAFEAVENSRLIRFGNPGSGVSE